MLIFIVFIDNLHKSLSAVLCTQLPSHLLVDHVAYEAHAGGAPRLVVPLEAPLEVEDEPLEQQLPDVRELGVDDRRQGRVHVGERGGGGLGLRWKITIISEPHPVYQSVKNVSNLTWMML